MTSLKLLITSHQLHHILKRTCVLLIALFFFTTSGWTQQDKPTKQSLEDERNDLKQQIEIAKQQLKDISNNKKSSLAEIALLQKKINLRQQKMNNINRELKEIDANIKNHKEEINSLKKNIDGLKEQYKKSIILSYQYAELYNPTYYLFASGSFSELVDRLMFLKRVRDLRSVQLEKIKTTSKQLKNELNNLSTKQENQTKILQEQSQELKTLKTDEDEKRAYVKQLKTDEKRLSHIIEQKTKQWQKIKVMIEKLIQKEIAENQRRMREAERAKKSHKKNTKQAAQEQPAVADEPNEKNNKNIVEASLTYSEKDFNLARDFQANKGRLPWPVKNAIVTMHFGKNRVTEESKITYDNSGLTIQTDPNTPVRSVFNGVVTNIQEMDDGYLITVRHGQYWSIYIPVLRPTVSIGKDVKTGEIIGYSPSSTPSELEFQLLRETKFQNPEVWLKR